MTGNSGSNKKYEYPMFQDPGTVGYGALGPAIVSLFFFPVYTGSFAIAYGTYGIYLGVKSHSKKCLVLSSIGALVGLVTVTLYFLTIFK